MRGESRRNTNHTNRCTVRNFAGELAAFCAVLLILAVTVSGRKGAEVVRAMEAEREESGLQRSGGKMAEYRMAVPLSERATTRTEEAWGGEQVDDWLHTLLEQFDFSALDDYSDAYLPKKYVFGDLVMNFLAADSGKSAAKEVGRYVFELFFFELAASKDYFMQMLFFSAVYAAIRQLLTSKQPYVSEMAFLMVYAMLMVLLMNTFVLVSEAAEQAIGALTGYLSVLVPVFATALMVSGNAVSAGAFYELTFQVSALYSWLALVVILPAIHIYLLLSFLDQMFWEERFLKMRELIERGIRFVLKGGVTVVIGINCVQAMLAPARDKVTESVVLKSMSSLPGIGNTLDFGTDLILGCGILIKNSIGVAAMLLLLLICLVPILKIFVFTVLYRLLAAVMEPVTDRRLVRGVSSTARATELYLVLLRDGMLIFLLSVAMVSASTSFMLA